MNKHGIIAFLSLTVLYLMAMLAILAIKANAEYVTSENGLRLRKEPSLEAEVIRVLPFGTEVKGAEKDGWFETEQGFLKSEYLSEDNPLDGFEYLGDWWTTAYTHSGNLCADGSYPVAGYSVATNSLPLGSEIYIQGIGHRTVTDRGPGSMPDAWLDLFLDSYGECIQFGEQYHAVYLKKTP